MLLGPWSLAVAVAVVLAAMAGGWLFDPARIGVELCWLRAISGLPCPGCGLTRSVCHLARGEVGLGGRPGASGEEPAGFLSGQRHQVEPEVPHLTEQGGHLVATEDDGVGAGQDRLEALIDPL